MPFWKTILLGLYYHASLPMRRQEHRRAMAEGRVPLLVLFYHRVADDRATPWTMSYGQFERQVRWLRDHFDLISLEETQRRIRSGRNCRPSVSITFDDGYADNCRDAIPLLVRERIPCTYFVSLRNVLEGVAFEHDVDCHCRATPNSAEELCAMAAAGIEIGAHTYNHLDLGRVTDRGTLAREIVVARQQLETAIGQPVRYFAFPFGHHAHMTAAAFDMTVRGGYAGACSAYGGCNLPGDDAFHLQRIPADGSMLRLKNWLTGDPRKRHIPRFPWKPRGRTLRPQTDAPQQDKQDDVSTIATGEP